MDTVFIRGLDIQTIIGCYEHEKLAPQRIVLDIEMAWDIKKAAASDALDDTLDYNAVRLRIESLCASERFELVESLAERVTALVMSEFNVSGIRLRLAKPEAIDSTIDVGVAISRGVAF